jgi:hypothetical protein
MQKKKFGVACPGVLFLEIAQRPPEQGKLCVDILRPLCTKMHFMTHRSHWMQKHKFGVTCPGLLIMETAPNPPEQEKECIDVSRRWFTEKHYMTH